MKSIAFIFLLLLLNSFIIYSQDDQSLYLGGGKISLGMTEREVIEQFRNSSYMKAVSNEGFISLIDNNNELIGIVTISNGKATSICKEWLIDSSLDRDIAHIFNILFNLLKKYETDIVNCRLELDSFFDPQLESKDIVIKFNENKSIKIQVLYKDKINISECIGMD